jgi:predicted CoA-substrate-specific enzyme activase
LLRSELPVNQISFGIDVGSISINSVVMDDDGRVIEETYTWCRGRPFHELHNVLTAMFGRFPPESVYILAFTGSGGELAARLSGGRFVNEIVAQSTSVGALYPVARSIIEMGGEDSKLIMLAGTHTSTPEPASLQQVGAPARGDGGSRLEDFSLNSMCAAGTGSFLDQQARRMGVSIVGEFGALALRSEKPPRIAGRCSVFAKSDMIHLQQIATPMHDIAAGLCFAVARNFKSTLARGKEIQKPVVFQGGVAANAGMVRAFRELLGLREGELIIPEHHASMGAIGAVLHARGDAARAERPGPIAIGDLEELRQFVAGQGGRWSCLAPLKDTGVRLIKEADGADGQESKIPVSLGLDIGSLSTNVVLIDDSDRIIARRYLPTASKPLEAIRQGLREIAEEVGERVDVRAVGTTGSGRYLTGDFVGGDVIQNEITAQATAAIAHDPTVDTIFEIGGQDSKYISVDRGVIVDFEMNKVCAAGTGSFLEEQAEKLGIDIVGQFGEMALSADRPAHLGDRCTVFMESDLNSHQQKGVDTANLVGGLAYSIVYNYIQKVVGTKRIGERIFFQGGVANNRSVVAAFEKVTGRKITVPPHFDVTGAIGAAMLARTRMRETEAAGGAWTTRFKGFDISRIPYALSRFTCTSCTNQCEIRRVSVEGETRPLHYGGRCEKWERDERKGRGKDVPNLFEERLRMLRGDFREEEVEEGAPRRPTIGIPRALMVFYQQFPFWRTFFEDLGFRIVLSRPTDSRLIQRSLEMLNAESCLPVEVMYGHIRDLLDRGVDHIFAPFAVSARAAPANPTANYNCPWVQAYPFMIRSALGEKDAAKVLMPALHFRYFERVLPRDLSAFMRDTFGITEDRVLRALALADDAQGSFERALEVRGREVLETLPPGKVPLVVLGRPYNTSDASLNLGLVEKLINLNVLPLPLDYLPLTREPILQDYYMMCWPNGQRILAAARIVARDPRLHAVCIGNFRCGPDSFLAHYLRVELAGTPYLQLEVDEHSADAGMITRCEAFLDSLRGAASVSATVGRPADAPSPAHRFRVRASAHPGRTLFFPYMCDSVHAVAAACRSCGVDSWALPMQDEEDLQLGRRHTSGRECFPVICTLGSFLKKLREPGIDPRRTSFFMPDHGGPCRFGQYNKLMRIVFDKLGMRDVEIVAPSNEDAWAGLSGGHGNRFRLAALKGVMACDLLRKLLQERRPYEANPGETERVYRASLDRVVRCIEKGGGEILATMRAITRDFGAIAMREMPRRPVIAVVGEVFMRDNAACSGNLVARLEALGAETIMAPFRELLTYSTLRFTRDSRWKGDVQGIIRSKVQSWFTHRVLHDLDRAVEGSVELERDVQVEEMLDECGPYIHRDYDGDPALALGTAQALARTGISGVAHILPFTCLPGTIVNSAVGPFRADHEGIPWVNIDYDGQEDTALEMRLQPFMHQAVEFSRTHGHGAPRRWRSQAMAAR